MSLAFSHPWLLVLLPLALLPLLRRRGQPVSYSSLSLLPADPLSDRVELALRVAATLALVALLFGAAGLHRPAFEVQKVGSGAQIVLLLDRSRSMDETFGGPRTRNIPGLARRPGEPKGAVARKLLQEFVSSRRNDLYAMNVFSTRPIPILSLTDSQAMIQAAISAGNIGRGLASTDIGKGLISALEFFEGREFAGSRLVMLISDGGAKLDLATRFEIQNLLERHRVSLYWIYLRSPLSHGIMDSAAGIGEQVAPARALHEFFDALRTPYRVYDAEDPGALKSAIADVSELQSLPINYAELIPRRELTRLCYTLALPLLGMLVLAQLMEMRSWSTGAA